MQSWSSKEADLEAAVSDIIAIFTFTFEIYVQLSQHFAKMAMLKEYILILVDLLFWERGRFAIFDCGFSGIKFTTVTSNN